MKTIAFLVAAALPWLGAALPAQEEAPATETVWVMTYTKGGGWSAADKAKGVRATLTKELKGVERLVVDTTATVTLVMKNGAEPTKDDLNAVLGKVYFKPAVAKLEKVSRPIPAAVVEIELRGLGWADTAFQVRETLAKIDDVLSVHPHGDTGKVECFVKTENALTETSVKEALDGSKFKLVKMSAKSLTKKKAD